MAYIGKSPAVAALTASDITDGIVSNAKLAQDIISADTALAVTPATTDELLLSDAGTLKRIDYSVIAGVTEADMWRLTANLTSSADPITSNLERVDDASFEKIGTGMSVSSGTWTFPSTGLWWVLINWGVEVASTADPYMYINYTTDNGGAWSQALKIYAGDRDGSTVKMNSSGHQFFNITDISNDKLQISVANANSNVTTMSASDRNWTYFTFIKLGDSQ